MYGAMPLVKNVRESKCNPLPTLVAIIRKRGSNRKQSDVEWSLVQTKCHSFDSIVTLFKA